MSSKHVGVESVTDVTDARPRRSLWQSAAWVAAMRVGLAIVLLMTWELASGRLVDPLWISSPRAIATYLVDAIGSGQLIADLRVTFTEAALGFVFGSLAGVATGVVLGRLETLARVLNPFISALYGIPRIALAPLFIIWFGIGLTSKAVLSGVVVYFLVFFSTFNGVRNVSLELKQMVWLMGGNQRDIVRKIVLPAATPWIISGLKMSVPYAFIGAIVGEFIAASSGLGFRIQITSAVFNTTGTMGGILVIVVLVLLGSSLLDYIERRAMKWQSSATNTEGPRI